MLAGLQFIRCADQGDTIYTLGNAFVGKFYFVYQKKKKNKENKKKQQQNNNK